MADAPLLSLRDLSRTFGEGERARAVLRGVTLNVARGESLALLGRSGSGKSTLLNLVSGIDRPSAGSVWIAGQEVTAMSERRRTLFRRAHIGFVYQFFNLIPTLTVEENLLLPLELNGVTGRRARAAAREGLVTVRLDDRGAEFPDRLSGGEQQRVAIARALVHGPALVLADEPTGNLDLETGREVTALLDHLVRRAGRTLLLVTHDMQAAAIADRRLALADGRLTRPAEGAA